MGRITTDQIGLIRAIRRRLGLQGACGWTAAARLPGSGRAWGGGAGRFVSL